MKVLVTGADGLLGGNLVRELLNRNYQVGAFVFEESQAKTIEGLPIERFSGNILDFEKVKNVVVNYDYVVHCAASTSMFPPRSEAVNKVNIDGTKNIIKACELNGVKRMIYVGTANSFGSGTTAQLGVETNAYEAGKYGLDYMDSKYKAQQVVLQAVAAKTIDAVVINPTFMIGPYDSRPSSGELILNLYRNKIPGYTHGGKNWVAVKDVAYGIANALTIGEKGECYILGNENLSYKEAFEKIAKTIGVNPPKYKISKKILLAYGSLNSFLGKIFKFNPCLTRELAILGSEVHFYSAEKARKKLNIPQTPIEIAVKECYDWFQQNNYLSKK